VIDGQRVWNDRRAESLKAAGEIVIDKQIVIWPSILPVFTGIWPATLAQTGQGGSETGREGQDVSSIE
jgi:hypothetical protein